mgnify:CR=1 FL=1
MSNTEKREGISCPACGGNLTSRFNRSNHDIKSFSYNNHNFGIRKCSSTHYIRLDFLEQVVLMVGRSADQGAVVGAKKLEDKQMDVATFLETVRCYPSAGDNAL